MSKLNIFKSEWIDMVFEGRNKKYGAYQLRSENPRTTTKALIVGIILFVFVVALPKIYNAIEGLASSGADEEKVELVEIIEIPEPPVEELPPPPPVIKQIQAPKSIVEEVKFKPLEAAKKEEVPDDPPKIEQFKDADPGDKNKDASPDGDVNIGNESGDLKKGDEPAEDPNALYTTAGLQVQPAFPGSFQSEVQKQMRLPEVDRDLDVRVYIAFVVEKDGTMTNIKCTRDPGYGLGKEAERAVKSIKKKWEPGVQNGKAVRVSYSLPIVIRIKS